MQINNSIFSLQKRLIAVFMLVTFIFFVIILRLGVIQFGYSGWLQAKAMEQWLRDVPTRAYRGKICDTNNVTLATSYTTYDVYVKPSNIINPSQVALDLSQLLGKDYEDVYKRSINLNASEVLIKLQVEEKIAQKIIKLGHKGVVLSENNARFYAFGDLLTQVLGFTTIDNIGQAGLESHYDKYLKGVDGYICQQADVNGVQIDNSLTYYVPSIAGCNLNLTIDVNIQKYCENALNLLITEQKPTSASMICVNPNSGEILAMCTKPSFDLNNVPRNDISNLLKTVKNINITDVYEPGSTFKVLTMATALQNNITSLDEHFFDPGYRLVDGEKIKCWKLTGHGSQTLTEGLCNSCNSVFVDLALRMGKDGIYKMFENFNLGKTLGIDFSGESAGILMDKTVAKNVDIARMGFGQAVAVTPLQEIMAISSVLNDGKLYKPYFVKNITDVNNNIIYENTPNKIKDTISAETSLKMREMFEAVVKKFSGFNAFIPGYKIGGKTGTTQKYDSSGRISGEYIASFIGCLPADEPEYVLLVVVDEPKGDSYYGSIVATPYAKLVFEDIIKYKNIKATELDADIIEYVRNISMPNLVGQNVYEALNILTSLGLNSELVGDGDSVVKQFPSPNTMLYLNSIVQITT